MAAQAQAQLYAAAIQDRAAQLVAQDTAIAAKITTASAPLNGVNFPDLQQSPAARALGAGFKLDHQWDPYTDQPAHGPFEPAEPGRPQFDPKTGTVEGGGGCPPTGGKGGSGGEAGGKGEGHEGNGEGHGGQGEEPPHPAPGEPSALPPSTSTDSPTTGTNKSNPEMAMGSTTARSTTQSSTLSIRQDLK